MIDEDGKIMKRELPIFSVLWASSEQVYEACELIPAENEADAQDRLYNRLKELGHDNVTVGRATEVVSPKKVRTHV